MYSPGIALLISALASTSDCGSNRRLHPRTVANTWVRDRFGELAPATPRFMIRYRVNLTAIIAG